GAGIGRGGRVAVMLPPLPESAATFLAAYKLGAILLSLSILYGDDAIAHRLRDAGAKVVVTDAANRGRIDRLRDDLPELERVLVVGEDYDGALAAASDRFDTADTSADDPAQLYYSSGTTGLAKGILHAHRYLLAHEEFVYCHEVEQDELFHGMGEWAWAAGICPLLGPWRYGATQLVFRRAGGFDPDQQ